MFKKDKEVTTELIEEYLDRYGWPKHEAREEQGEQRGVVVTGWLSDVGEGLMVHIDPIIEKGVLVFAVTGVATVDPDLLPTDRLVKVLMRLLDVNQKSLGGAFGLNPVHGDVSLRLVVPIATDRLSYDDFERCLRGVVLAVDAYGPSIRSLIATG